MKKALIIQTAFIGDVILATPIIENLRITFPDLSIDFLVRKGNETLLKGHPHVNEVLIWDKSKGKYRKLLKLLSIIRQSNYDVVINVQRFASTGFLTGFSNAKSKIGFTKNPLSFLFTEKVDHDIDTSKAVHEVDRNLKLSSKTSGNKTGSIRLYPSQNDFDKVKHLKKTPYICIAPSSVWKTKEFPISNWIEFISSLGPELKVFLIGSSADKKTCEEIQKGSKSTSVEVLAGMYNLLETAALLKDAQMNFSNDSAPMHIASAMNAPITAVFCSTIPEFGFGPKSKQSFVIQTQENIVCRPCGLHGKKVCPEGHFKCATTITNKQLLNVLR